MKFFNSKSSKNSANDAYTINVITTPFLDRHHDHLQIYVKKTKKGFILSDDGYIMADLELSGVDYLNNAILRSIFNKFGIKIVNDELVLEATDDNFEQKKDNFIQALVEITKLIERIILDQALKNKNLA